MTTTRAHSAVKIFASNAAALIALPTPEEEFGTAVGVAMKAARQYFSAASYSQVNRLFVLDIAKGLTFIQPKDDGTYTSVPLHEFTQILTNQIQSLQSSGSAESALQVEGLTEYLNTLENAPNGLNQEDRVIQPLQWLLHLAPKGVYIVTGWADYLKGEQGNPEVVRLLAAMASRFQEAASTEKKRVFLVAPSIELPKDLAIPTLEYTLPTALEISDLVSELVDQGIETVSNSGITLKFKLGAEGLTALSRRAQGLSSGEITAVVREHIYGRIVTQEKDFDVIDERLTEALVNRKISKLQALGVTFAEAPDVEPRGMDNLVKWASRQKKVYWHDEEKTPLKLSMAGATLLVGPPGTGKTLMAKTLGSSWGLPVLSLKLGSLYGSLVGSTESKTREVFSLIEKCGNCIVLIDEIDKATGALEGGGDAGTSKRLFKALLEWLSDKPRGVYAVMTANDPRSILKHMPELFRDGRVGAIWFADLPNEQGRVDILSAHLQRVQPKGTRITAKELLTVSDETNNMTGAELAAAVNSATEEAYFDSSDTVTLAHLKKALSQSKKMVEFDDTNIEVMRQWARKNARPVHSGYASPAPKAAKATKPKATATESDVVLQTV